MKVVTLPLLLENLIKSPWFNLHIGLQLHL